MVMLITLTDGFLCGYSLVHVELLRLDSAANELRFASIELRAISYSRASTLDLTADVVSSILFSPYSVMKRELNTSRR